MLWFAKSRAWNRVVGVARRWLSERAVKAAESPYTQELRFASLADLKPMPVYRTLSDAGVSLGETPHHSSFTRELALRVYQAMVKLHVTDSIFYEAQRQGRLSFYLTSFGEEAATVASAAALEIEDEAFLQYREQGVLMWRGFSARQMADPCFGNALELGKGRQMPVHYGDPKLHVHTVSSVLGTQIVHAVGAAFALKTDSKPNVAVTYFGDGAASEGDFHASLNFAATLELPVLFFCRNNGYAISTPTSQQFKPYCMGIRGPSYGIQTVRVDGGDARAVYLATREARKTALEQTCPILIEAMCYRAGHHSTSDDSTRYRQEAEIQRWRAKEPVGRLLQFLSENGWWSEAENEELKQQARNEAVSALDEAEKVKKRPVTDLFTDVYDSIPWHLQEQRQELMKFLQAHPEQCPKDIPIE